MENLSNPVFNPSKSPERESFFVEIEGEKINVIREEFKYPEDIKNETKIEGYTKYKINKDDLENFINDPKHKELFDIYDNQIKKKKAEIKQKFPGYDSWQNKEYVEELNQCNIEWEQGYEKLDPKVEILRILSNGNFPDKTYNHVIQGDADYNKPQKEELYNNKFILGKIDNVNKYDTALGYRFGKSVQVMTNKQGEVVLTGDFSTSSTEDYVNYNSWEGDKEDGDGIIVDKTNFSSPKEIPKEEFNRLVEDNVIISTMGGIYSGYGQLWDERFVKPVFGFDPNEKPFKDYLTEVKNIYEKLPGNVISNKSEISLEHLFSDIGSKNKESVNGKNLISGEVMIPVMTGNTGLPQMCWGHAKYAVIPTEKNLNFLEIHHSKE